MRLPFGRFPPVLLLVLLAFPMCLIAFLGCEIWRQTKEYRQISPNIAKFRPIPARRYYWPPWPGSGAHGPLPFGRFPPVLLVVLLAFPMCLIAFLGCEIQLQTKLVLAFNRTLLASGCLSCFLSMLITAFLVCGGLSRKWVILFCGHLADFGLLFSHFLHPTFQLNVLSQRLVVASLAVLPEISSPVGFST